MKYRFPVMLLPLAGLLALLAGCGSGPEFPVEPAIWFEKVEFVDANPPTQPLEALKLTIGFQDGNGDLGISNSAFDEEEFPQHLFFYKDNPVNREPILYNDPCCRDTLPPYEYHDRCLYYTIQEHNNPLDPDGKDTVYVQPNPRYNNIYVRFYRKLGGDYVEFDWLRIFPNSCGTTYNGRFPLLNEELASDPTVERPLEGSLEYSMSGSGFEINLGRFDTVSLEVFIYDRAGNKSNVVRTPDFVIADITVEE